MPLDTKGKLERLAVEVAGALIVDPDVRVEGVECEILELDTFESPRPSATYLVTVRTNDVSMLRGRVGGYTANYKERLEGSLQHALDVMDSGSRVYVEIVGPDSGIVERIIPIQRLISAGKLRQDSPLTKIAVRFRLDCAILRGRHLVGPSPAIAMAVEKFVASEKSQESILDLFAGTAIGARVVLEQCPEANTLCIDADPRKVAVFGRNLPSDRATYLTANVFTFEPSKRFNLVIADPYYEDALWFLEARGTVLREAARNLIFCSGGVENRDWNQRVELRLETLGFRTTASILFGRYIIVCR